MLMMSMASSAYPYTGHKKMGQRECGSHKIGRKVEEYGLQDTAQSMQTQTHSRRGCLQWRSNRSQDLLTANEWPSRAHGDLVTSATKRFLRMGIHYFQLYTHRNVQQDSMDSSQPTVTQEKLIKLNGPQNKTKMSI